VEFEPVIRVLAELGLLAACVKYLMRP